MRLATSRMAARCDVVRASAYIAITAAKKMKNEALLNIIGRAFPAGRATAIQLHREEPRESLCPAVIQMSGVDEFRRIVSDAGLEANERDPASAQLTCDLEIGLGRGIVRREIERVAIEQRRVDDCHTHPRERGEDRYCG